MHDYETDKKVLLLRLSPPVYQKNPHPIGCRPPYTLKYIEALLRREGSRGVKYVDQQITDLSVADLGQLVREYSPDCIVLDVSILNYKISVDLLNRLRKEGDSGWVVIGVGQEVSADIKAFRDKNPQFDFLFAGEAEQEVVMVIKKMGRGVPLSDIKQFYRENNSEDAVWTINELNSLPYLYYDKDVSDKYSFVYPLKKAKRLRWGHMLTSRGCPHPCIFCSQLMRESYGRKVRLRSAEHVVDEMEYLLEQGVNIIAFDDDNFTNSYKHAENICREIIKRNLKIDWIIHARIDEVPKDLLELMSRAGCVLIRFGLETRVERLLTILHKTDNVKKWVESGEPTVKKARSCGISVACLFQVGSPTETLEDVQQSIDYAKLLDPDMIQIAYFTPFPGTAAYQMFRQQVEKLSNEELYHYGSPVINVSAMTDKELIEAQSLFYKLFLLRPVFVLRHFASNFLFYIMNFGVFKKLLRVMKIF